MSDEAEAFASFPDCADLERRVILLTLVHCINPAIRAGEMTDALRHQVERLAATYDGEYAVALAEAIVDRPPARAHVASMVRLRAYCPCSLPLTAAERMTGLCASCQAGADGVA